LGLQTSCFLSFFFLLFLQEIGHIVNLTMSTLILKLVGFFILIFSRLVLVGIFVLVFVVRIVVRIVITIVFVARVVAVIVAWFVV